jgi:hypothetical protein
MALYILLVLMLAAFWRVRATLREFHSLRDEQ